MNTRATLPTAWRSSALCTLVLAATLWGCGTKPETDTDTAMHSDAVETAETTPSAVFNFDDPPRPTKQVPPQYPEASRAAGEEGMVHVQATLNPSGAIVDLKIVKSSGSEAFETAAMAAAEGWVFEAAHKDGKAVASQVVIPFQFKLE